jgi:hypothetical protein
MAPVKKRKEPAPLIPFIYDNKKNEIVSPDKLPFYAGSGPRWEIDAAYDLIQTGETAEEFYNAVSVLVFHARHLSPSDHAELAHLVSKPFKRKKGKPENKELKREAYDYAWACKSSLFKSRQKDKLWFIRDLSDKYKTPIAVVNRALKEAKEIVDLEKIKQKKGTLTGD